MTNIAFRIRQNGQTVARVESNDPISAEAEIMHYARQYREDGEVTVQHNAEGHWKRFALLCQWPPSVTRLPLSQEERDKITAFLVGDEEGDADVS